MYVIVHVLKYVKKTDTYKQSKKYATDRKSNAYNNEINNECFFLVSNPLISKTAKILKDKIKGTTRTYQFIHIL